MATASLMPRWPLLRVAEAGGVRRELLWVLACAGTLAAYAWLVGVDTSGVWSGVVLPGAAIAAGMAADALQRAARARRALRDGEARDPAWFADDVEADEAPARPAPRAPRTRDWLLDRVALYAVFALLASAAAWVMNWDEGLPSAALPAAALALVLVVSAARLLRHAALYVAVGVLERRYRRALEVRGDGKLRVLRRVPAAGEAVRYRTTAAD
jgi:hypothetical protein